MSTPTPEDPNATRKRPAHTGKDYLAYIGVGIPAALLCASIIYFMNRWFDSIGWGHLQTPMTPGRAVVLSFIFYSVLSALQRYWWAVPIFFFLAFIIGGLVSHIV